MSQGGLAERSRLLQGFLWVARFEGLSLLVMFLVAMPLKYLFGHPEAVLAVGWIHGLLFIAYVVALGLVAREQGWSMARIAAGFVASLLPAGTFVFERRIEG
ncbi:MAG: DUF3817 domain-containing protein [Alphaproteobacteria bacterium]|nr:DUF3817 domain-containing protein [Alphaproteobacteria bacterium]